MHHKRFQFFAICALGAIFAASSIPAIAQTFKTFDVAGSNGTFPVAINTPGAITGSYSVYGSPSRSFVRSRSGVITTFNVPHAAYGTVANDINDAGTITGVYDDIHGIAGFVRSAQGAFTTFDVPGAVYGNGYVYTFAASINHNGSVTGSYYNNTGYHGFLRARTGSSPHSMFLALTTRSLKI